MAMQGPGKVYHKGLSLYEITELFPDEKTARKWFEQQRWPQGPYCPQCGTFNVQSNAKHKTQTHRCRECKKGQFFSVKKGTVMEGSNLGLQVWAIAIYLITTGVKNISSMKLHRNLDVTYKSAWHLSHRLRKAFETDASEIAGPVKVDESYFAGIEGKKHASKIAHSGGGVGGRVTVVSIKGQAHSEVTL